MIVDLMLALAYWIFGLLFALCGFCALGFVTSLFLCLIRSFKTPASLIAVPLLVLLAFASLGGCWLFQWIYLWLGFSQGHAMQFWFIVGAVLPGLLGIGLVPKIVGLNARKVASSTPAGDSVKA